MSPLQLQYPLSPRKFWKKLIEKTVWGVGVFIIIEFLVLLFGLLSGTVSSEASIYWIQSSVAAFLLFVGVIALYAWYVRVYIRRYYYDANENFLTIKKGVFAPTEIHVQYQKIQDVYVDQDILDRIMGLYDVHIASATAMSGMEAHIDGVEFPAAEGLKTLLLGRIQGGHLPTTQSAPTVATGSPSPIFSEDVSDKSYPIENRWIFQNLILYFFSSLFFATLLTLWSPSSSEEGSVATAVAAILGISEIGVWFWSFIILFAGHMIYALIWRSTFTFAFLPEYIVMRSGIISRSEVHIPYRTIQDVVVSQGIIERLLDIATVRLQNAAAAQMVGRTIKPSGINIPGQPLDRANHLSELVKSIVLTKNPNQTGL